MHVHYIMSETQSDYSNESPTESPVNKDILMRKIEPYIEKIDTLVTVDKDSLEEGKLYLVYTVNDIVTNYRRKHRTYVEFTLGYYGTKTASEDDVSHVYDDDDDYGVFDSRLFINMTDTIQLSYTILNKYAMPNPINDLDKYKHELVLNKRKNDFVKVGDTMSTKIYKIGLPQGEYIPGLNEYFTNLKYAPVEINNSSISFIGKKYRKTRDKWNKTHKKSKGGKPTKSNKRRNRTNKNKTQKHI